MDDEVQLKDDRIVPAKLIIWEAAPEHPKLVQLSPVNSTEFIVEGSLTIGDRNH